MRSADGKLGFEAQGRVESSTQRSVFKVSCFILIFQVDFLFDSMISVYMCFKTKINSKGTIGLNAKRKTIKLSKNAGEKLWDLRLGE